MLYLLRRLRKTPEDHFRQDYEMLVRLARRCAYDMRHASDDVGVDKPFMDSEMWAMRANWWISVFNKGNPGKDYRHQLMLERDRARAETMLCVELLEQHGIPVPDSVTASPF